jgi:hypothetical protein
LNLAEMLRPWRSAGITHFLIDNSTHFTPFDDTIEIETGQPEIDIPETTRSYQTRHPTPPVISKTEEQFQPRNISSPSAVLHTEAKKGDEQQKLPDLPLAQWPRNWSALFSKTRAAAIVWSYPELGADLTGNSDKERGLYLRTLIGALNLPKGSSTFWPLSLPDDGEDAPGLFFQLGLQLLQPRAVLLFGKESIRQSSLSIPLSSPYTQTILQGVLYILLPDFSTLMSKKESVTTTCTFLREMLRTIPALFPV